MKMIANVVLILLKATNKEHRASQDENTIAQNHFTRIRHIILRQVACVKIVFDHFVENVKL